MPLSNRWQLGGSALIERGQLISTRPVVAVLASCVQTRMKRGPCPLSLEPSIVLTYEQLCLATWATHAEMPYMFWTSQNHSLGKIGTTQCNKDHTGQIYSFGSCFHLPCYASEQGKDFHQKLGKLWFIMLVASGTGENVGPREPSILSICCRPVPDAGYQTRCAICLFLNGISYVPNTKQTLFIYNVTTSGFVEMIYSTFHLFTFTMTFKFLKSYLFSCVNSVRRLFCFVLSESVKAGTLLNLGRVPFVLHEVQISLVWVKNGDLCSYKSCVRQWFQVIVCTGTERRMIWEMLTVLSWQWIFFQF